VSIHYRDAEFAEIGFFDQELFYSAPSAVSYILTGMLQARQHKTGKTSNTFLGGGIAP
jgi:hypothetical protein